MRAQAELDARALRILSRRDLSTALAGAYRSAFRGRGLTFEELRDYQPGDDVRWIEWNATARLGRPIVKRMREERDIVLALLVDVSSSLDFGHAGGTKRAAALRAAAALAAAAVAAQDRVALASFADRLVATLAPAGGPFQLERLLHALVEKRPRPGAARAGTDSRQALDWALDSLPRHTVAVLISDLLFPDPGAPLRRLARKHELVVLRVCDRADVVPGGLAPLRVAPAEAGPRGLVRTRRRRREAPLAQPPLDERALRGVGADVGTLWTGLRLIPSLHHFFAERGRRAA